MPTCGCRQSKNHPPTVSCRAFLLALVLVLSPSLVSAQSLGITAGYPYALCYVSMQNSASFSIDYVQKQIYTWIPSYDTRFSKISGPGEVIVTDVAITGVNVEFKISVATRFGNGYIDQVLQTLTNGGNPYDTHLQNILGTNYSLTSRTVVENASPDVAISFSEFGRQYVNSWTGSMSMILDFSPMRNKKLVVTFVNADVTLNPYPLVISWPERTTTFRMFSPVSGTKVFTRSVDANTTDSISRYQFYVYIPTLQVDPLASVVITPPSSSILNYNMTPSNPFTIAIPSSYRDATLNLVVTVHAYPSTMIVTPSNVSITKRGVNTFTFFVTAPVGTYVLNYTIAPPWNGLSTNNNYFAQPTYQHTVVYRPPLNITTQNIEDGYMVHTPITSTYGGAYSRQNIIHLEKLPKVALTITVIGTDCQTIPSSITFYPTSNSFAYFQLRGLSTGVKPIKFVLSGSSAADYDTPAPRSWVVHNRNPICFRRTSLDECFQTLGCAWNSLRGFCVNNTVPILVDRVPTLFDQEQGSSVNVTLATPVRNSLTIKFVTAARLVFSPAQITLSAGATNFTFRATGYLGARDGITVQSFYLQLSGADANTFDQTASAATIRPKIVCSVTIPAPFYVNTESDNFVISCDGPPEEEVFFTPVPRKGLSFVPVGMSVGLAVKMDSTTSSGAFVAVSVGVVGSFNVQLVISGKNAARYEAIAVVVTRTLSSATVNVPPMFRFVEYEVSTAVHVDLSATPTFPLYVNMTVINNTTKLPAPEDVRLTPNQLIFNGTNRATLSATGFTLGNYTIIYNVSGANKANYLTPNTSSFEIRSYADGNAFTYRLKLGYQPKTACRMSVGMNSQTFYGQDQVALSGDFCDNLIVLPKANSTGAVDCPAQPSEQRCRNLMATTGTICYWYNNTCNYVEAMQGVAREFAYGSSFIAFLTVNSTVYTLGDSSFGQLGHSYAYNLSMVEGIPETIASITVGSTHAMALADSGAVYVWGGNSKGQLGTTANVLQSQTVRLVEFPFGELITCISAGVEHSGAVTTRGELYMWGSNEYGQLGQQSSFRSKITTPVIAARETFANEVVSSLQLGEFHTMVATDISAYTFGSNSQGQLGRPGWDEYVPSQPILWFPTKFVDRPSYPSYLRGNNQC